MTDGIFGPPIDVHTRADALAAGDLVAARADLAGDAGFRVPVALTLAAWADCVAWADEDHARTGAIQDEDGRLYDVLWMAARAFSSPKCPGDEAVFEVWRVSRDARPGLDGDIDATAVYLVAARSEDGVTIALPDED